jgi:predicted nucleic acid-binding protein
MINKILCDTDFLVAYLIENEPNHKKAKKIIEKYQDSNFIYSNLTKYELMTVLSSKLEQKLAVQALEIFEDIFTEEFEFDRSLEPEILGYYKTSKNKNQSFSDITCLVQAKHFKCQIASFDKFYPKDLLIS